MHLKMQEYLTGKEYERLKLMGIYLVVCTVESFHSLYLHLIFFNCMY